MTQPQASGDTKATGGRPLDAFLQANEGAIGIGLLVAAGLFLIVPLVNLIWNFRSQPTNGPVAVWGMALAAVALFGGLWLRLREPTREIGPIDGVRLALLTVGSLAGLATVLLGLWLPFSTWSFAFIPAAPSKDVPAVPIIRLWRENAWRITACVSAVFFGLALMFASLQLARLAVRASATMRRLLFGYNAALTGLLLLAILFVVNVLAYVPMKPFAVLDRTIDWTPSQIYTLSDATENLLKGLDKPTRLVILMPRNLLVTRDAERLAENLKKVDGRLEYRLIEPDKNPEDADAEQRKYRIPDRDMVEASMRGEELIGGVVVEYGSDHVFIRGRDLSKDISGNDGKSPRRYTFVGEKEVAKALRKLSEKAIAKIYFTQGNGELDLNDATRVTYDQGAGVIKEHLLSRGNYEVLELKLGGSTEAVPNDAHVVVVARPTTPLSSRAVEALRAYLKRPEKKDKDDNVIQTKGKLVVLLDVVTSGDKMVATGLEGLLREYNVETGQDRLLSLDGRRPDERPENVLVTADPRSRNPVAQAFSRGSVLRIFTFRSVRSIVPQKKGGPMGASSFTVDSLLIAARPVWKTTDLTTPPQRLFDEYVQNHRQELRKQLYLGLSVAVTVSEGSQSAPFPGHTPVASKETPRLVVFGDATWLTNTALLRPEGKDARDLFASCVSWLRERPDVGMDVPDKIRPVFTLAGKVEPGSGAASRLFWLPPMFILLSILALGGGVWVVRRR